MPGRIDKDERPIIASFTILPEQKRFLEERAKTLSFQHGVHISASTIVRTLIDNYAQAAKQSEANQSGANQSGASQ